MWEQVDEEENSGGYSLLIVIAIAVHVFDAFIFRFEINTATFFYRLLFYFVLSFLAHFMLKHDLAVSLKEFSLISSIPVFIIPMLSVLLNWANIPSHIHDVVAGVALAVPVWLIYLLYVKGISQGWAAQLARFYMIILFILVLISAMMTTADVVGEVPGVESRGFDVWVGISSFWGFTYGTVEGLIERIRNLGGDVRERYQDLLNQTLGQYYTGQVEETREFTGVEIRSFRAIDTRFYEGQPITLSALIHARSFSEDVEMSFNCVAEDQSNRSNIVSGRVDPERVTVYTEDQRMIFCEFDDLPSGNYRIYFNADFNFETWAYTTYTFMERDYISSLRQSGENINAKYDIPRNPRTIYTRGPVMLGMNEELEMPLGLSYTDDTRIPVGMSMRNAQALTGIIKSIEAFEMRMPTFFELERCTRNYNPPIQDPNVDGYHVYVFPDIPMPADDRTHVTVSCNMRIPGQRSGTFTLGDTIDLMIQSGGKADVSIVGTAKYEYVLRSTANIRVEPDPLQVANQ